MFSKRIYFLCADFSTETLSPLSSSLFSQAIVLLCTSPLSLDLLMHRHLLLLAGNLASGIACSNGRAKEQPGKHEAETVNDYKYWNFLKDKPSSKNMEQLLVHIMRVLNIFQHVIEDLPSVCYESSHLSSTRINLYFSNSLCSQSQSLRFHLCLRPRFCPRSATFSVHPNQNLPVQTKFWTNRDCVLNSVARIRWAASPVSDTTCASTNCFVPRIPITE